MKRKASVTSSEVENIERCNLIYFSLSRIVAVMTTRLNQFWRRKRGEWLHFLLFFNSILSHLSSLYNSHHIADSILFFIQLYGSYTLMLVSLHSLYLLYPLILLGVDDIQCSHRHFICNWSHNWLSHLRSYNVFQRGRENRRLLCLITYAMIRFVLDKYMLFIVLTFQLTQLLE